MTAPWTALFGFVDERSRHVGAAIHRHGVEALGLEPGAEPDRAVLDALLLRKTGWTTAPCSGELPATAFFESLARRVFPLGIQTRGLFEVFGAADPDYWHEAYGHLPVLLDEKFAALYAWFGRAHGRALTLEKMEWARQIERLYWFTLEYGLIQERGRPKVLGAGLIASPLGIERYVRGQVRLAPLRVKTVLNAHFDPHLFQKKLFVLEEFNSFCDDIVELYRGLDVGHVLI